MRYGALLKQVKQASLLAVLLAVAACGDDASSTPAPGTSSTADGGGGGGGGGGRQDGGSNTPNPNAINIEVEFGDNKATVDLTTLDQIEYQGTPVVSLLSLWEASELGGSAAVLDFEFDFEGDDGFRPTSRDRCKTLVDGMYLEKGYILPETRTLIWDDETGLPGCYGVKGVAKVIASEKP